MPCSPPAQPRDPAGGPVLVNVVGPPAAGKMSVAHELSLRTGLRLFHNHQTIDLVMPFFDFSTPQFSRLVGSFRRQILSEVAASDLPGVVFSYVWAFDQPDDEREVESYAAPFRERGLRVMFVELEASQAERLRRNRGDFRLAQKPSKRDLEWSEAHLLEMDRQHQLSSQGRFDDRDDWYRVDNTNLSAADVAEMVINHFELCRR